MFAVQNPSGQMSSAQPGRTSFSEDGAEAEILSAISASDVRQVADLVARHGADVIAGMTDKGIHVMDRVIESGSLEMRRWFLEYARNHPDVFLDSRTRNIVRRLEGAQPDGAARSALGSDGAAYRRLRPHGAIVGEIVDHGPVVPDAADLPRLFESAILRADKQAAQWYFDTGVESIPVMRQLADKGRESELGWMVQNHFVRGNDVLTILNEAVQAQNQGLVRILTGPKTALAAVAAMKDQSSEVKFDALKQFVDAGSSRESLTIEAARRLALAVKAKGDTEHDYEVLQHLVGGGAPALAALVDQAERGNRVTVQAMVDAGTSEAINAVEFFHKRGHRDAAAILEYAILKQMLEANAPVDLKKGFLEMFLSLGWTGGKELLRDKVIAGDLDGARMLVSAGMSPTELLTSLALVQRSDLAPAAIELGADPAAATNLLRRVRARLEADGKQEAANAVQAAVDELNARLAQ
ncbi:hypothetical protein [Bordetella sp. 02P26C-1]|uniref:hypothetical protein n=1 Tax=Bordetella sp. 02P26C-1 TaxID=2683195 RepID=UPI001352E879|nr:hypothetical protein [Bordetella sp. 02P26C-1]MVW78884.1 hypothetical protein [Bordetella sp. 02P26C-1]